MSDTSAGRFGFGQNFLDWQAREYDEKYVEVSRRRLCGFLGLPSLEGKRMLDIGCGPGLVALAATRAGAKVTPFDYDRQSVEATRRLNPGLSVMRGDALDEAFMRSLGTFDIVYSWGVLHHTGDMWKGVRNAAACVAPGGLFYIALYDRDFYRIPSPEFWLKVKRRYVEGGWLTKRVLEYGYVIADVAWKLARFRSPTRHMREYRERRGMSYMVAVRDWVGGWPMEYATTSETTAFVTGLGLGLKLVKLETVQSCAEYLFQRSL